eukprot:sb/3476373/
MSDQEIYNQGEKVSPTKPAVTPSKHHVTPPSPSKPAVTPGPETVVQHEEVVVEEDGERQGNMSLQQLKEDGKQSRECSFGSDKTTSRSNLNETEKLFNDVLQPSTSFPSLEVPGPDTI